MRVFTFKCVCSNNDKVSTFSMQATERYADRAAKIIIKILKEKYESITIQYIS